MKTSKTIEAARKAAKTDGAIEIAEIDHATEGRVFIGVKCQVETLKKILTTNPMPEIKAIISAHDTRTDAEIEADDAWTAAVKIDEWSEAKKDADYGAYTVARAKGREARKAWAINYPKAAAARDEQLQKQIDADNVRQKNSFAARDLD